MADTDTVERRTLVVVESKRKAAGLSQEGLAERTGIPLATLNRYINHGGLKFWHLERIAAALDSSVSAITAEAEAS